MTEEEIKALVSTMLTEATDKLAGSIVGDVRAYMDDQLEPLRSQVTDLAKPKPEEKPADDDSPLSKRLAQMEKDLADERTKREEAESTASNERFSNAIGSALAESDVLYPDQLRKQLLNDLRHGSKEENGRWLTAEGKTIPEAVSAFLETDYGKHFVRPTVKEGVGTAKPEGNRPAGPSMSEVIQALTF